MTQTKNRRQKVKEKLNQINENLQQTSNKIKEKTNATKAQIATIKPRLKNQANKATTKIKNIKLPKINLKINFSHKNKDNKNEIETETQQKVLPKGVKVIEKYPVYEPFSQILIIQDPKTGEHKYILDELQLDPMEHDIYKRILNILLAEIQSPKEEIVDPRKFFAEEARKIVDKYRISLGWLPDVSWYKILYHAERDLVGFGKIDSLMRDPNIEDVSCDGVNRPVYIWHRLYESIETNLQFESDEELDNLVVKLVHMSGKHVSSAFPIVDASLPGKHRLAVAYRREITPFGTAFTIRKFRDDPYSIIDLINIGTFTEEMAAYLWICLENRASVMVLGGTAAGKTTALNALGLPH